MHPIKHFKTIWHHHNLVMYHCFKCGLYKQGILHDASKFAPVEFWGGAKYYQGTRSPNTAQREAIGYTASWLHHKGRNKHHWEYWIDFGTPKADGLQGMRMPEKYVAESICDRIAACKVYQGDKYTQASPWKYYVKDAELCIMHPVTRYQLETCLRCLRDNGEDAMFHLIKNWLLTYDNSENDKAYELMKKEFGAGMGNRFYTPEEVTKLKHIED